MINRATRARTKVGASAKQTVATPKIAVVANMMRPRCPEIGERARISAMMMAPAAGAARNSPKPSGPVMKISRAKTGSSAVALPNSTANRSSSTAPSTILVAAG